MDYRSELSRILSDYTAASRGVLDHLIDIDIKTTRAGSTVFEHLHPTPDADQPETPEERAAREAREEQDRRTLQSARRARTHPTDWLDRGRDEDPTA